MSLVVVVGCEQVIVHNVIFDAFNIDKFLEFIETKVIPSINRQRFILMDNVSFYKSHEIQQTFENIGHIYFYLPSYSPFLNAIEWIT